MSERCFTCEIVTEYVNLANQFTQDLSASLVGPMTILFVAIAGLWIVIQGLRLMAVQTTLSDFGKEIIFVFMAWVLLVGQGPSLVNEIYQAALSMMGSAASVALKVGSSATANVANEAGASTQLGAGMTALVKAAETGIGAVFEVVDNIGRAATMTNPLPYLYATVLAIPYFLVLVVFFAQVVISIFRIIMVSVLSPYLMLGFGFGWGRGMAVAGIKTLLSSFMVLFGSTAALAVMLYGVNALNIGATSSEESMRDIVGIANPKFMLMLAMGWLGTAFIAEAVGIANSITGSVLSNTAVGVITAGAASTAAILSKPFRAAAGEANAEDAGKLAARVGHYGSRVLDWVKRAKGPYG